MEKDVIKRLIILSIIIGVAFIAFITLYKTPAAPSGKDDTGMSSNDEVGYSASSDDYSTITWITEAWPDFTQEDGVGVYHDLINAIFSSQNVTLNVVYAPWTRAVSNVKQGICDMTGGIDKSDDFYQSEYPIYEYQDLIVFKKGTIDWEGLHSLKGKNGVWVKDYLEESADRPIKEYATGIEIETFKSAVMFLHAGRADYLLSEKVAFHNHAKQIDDFEFADYDTVAITSGQLFFSFPRTERGKRMRDMYDRGYEALTRDEINTIYGNWDLTAPSSRME